MIRISQIDSKLSIYQNKKVVLLGLGKGTEEILKLLKYFRIEINCVCDNKKKNWGETFNSLKVISPPELKKMIENDVSNIILQVAIKDIDKTTLEKLKSYGVTTIIPYEETNFILNLMSDLKLYKFDPNNPIFNRKSGGTDLNARVKNTLYYENKPVIYIINIPKTGDYTLVNTFSKNKIMACMCLHSPRVFEFIKNEKEVKIITAIRDPISQNLSRIYHTFRIHKQFFDMIKDDDNFFKNGGDAQIIYDRLTSTSQIDDYRFSASTFLDDFKTKIIDLSQYSFDKENGYAIIKKNNIEVFVY